MQFCKTHACTANSISVLGRERRSSQCDSCECQLHNGRPNWNRNQFAMTIVQSAMCIRLYRMCDNFGWISLANVEFIGAAAARVTKLSAWVSIRLDYRFGKHVLVAVAHTIFELAAYNLVVVECFFRCESLPNVPCIRYVLVSVIVSSTREHTSNCWLDYE